MIPMTCWVSEVEVLANGANILVGCWYDADDMLIVIYMSYIAYHVPLSYFDM